MGGYPTVNTLWRYGDLEFHIRSTIERQRYCPSSFERASPSSARENEKVCLLEEESNGVPNGRYGVFRNQPYRQTSLRKKWNEKLLPKYLGPYKILEKIGPVAYKLELLNTAAITPRLQCIIVEKGIRGSYSSALA